MSSAARKIEPVLDDTPKEQWHQLSIEDAIQAAHRNTGISYQKDDSILSVVAILNAFGERLKSLMEDERRRFSNQFNNDVAGVNEAIDHKVNGVADTLKTLAMRTSRPLWQRSRNMQLTARRTGACYARTSPLAAFSRFSTGWQSPPFISF